MQSLYLNKYKRSTYKNESIIGIGLHDDGLVVICTLNHNPSFWVDESEVYEGASADYILCMFQDDININVLK